MNARVDLRSYAGETQPPFCGALGYTEREVQDAYRRGIARGATRGIAYATVVIGTGCGWLLWSAGAISFARIAGWLP